MKSCFCSTADVVKLIRPLYPKWQPQQVVELANKFLVSSMPYDVAYKNLLVMGADVSEYVNPFNTVVQNSNTDTKGVILIDKDAELRNIYTTCIMSLFIGLVVIRLIWKNA